MAGYNERSVRRAAGCYCGGICRQYPQGTRHITTISLLSLIFRGQGFATSVSVVLSTVFSIVYMDFVLSAQFTVGAMLVFVATFLYSQNYC